MKKLIFLLFLAFSLNTFAQIEKPITKGNKILSGGGTIQSSTSGSGSFKQSVFSLSLNPGIGFFVINNLAIGLNTNIGYTNSSGSGYYSLGIGPYVRYYFNNGLFLKGDFSYNYLHSLNSSPVKQKYHSFTPGIGYAFFLNQKVSLEPSISYKYETGSTNVAYRSQIVNSLLMELKFSIFL
jgi:outer membrane protein